MGKEVELSVSCSSKRNLEAGLACFQQHPIVIFQTPVMSQGLGIIATDKTKSLPHAASIPVGST